MKALVLAMLVLAACFCRCEDVEDVEDVAGRNALVRSRILLHSFPATESRAMLISEFQKVLQVGHDPAYLIIADYCIAKLLWERNADEKVYRPFKAYKEFTEAALKRHGAAKGDLRILWMEINLHDPAYGGAPKEEIQWLLKRLAAIDLDNKPALKLYEDASGQALILAIGDILIRTVLQGEQGAPENSGKGVAGAFDKALQMIREARENSKADFILEHKDALLARVQQRLKADAFKSTYRLPLDEIEKAAGKTERISADERRQELEKITHSRELDADAKVNYLLWLLKDGMALTDFSNTKATREYFEENIFTSFANALRLRSNDSAGFTRLAEMITACGEYNRLVWRVEGVCEGIAKEAKEQKQP